MPKTGTMHETLACTASSSAVGSGDNAPCFASIDTDLSGHPLADSTARAVVNPFR